MSLISRAVKEPLVHFLIFGALLFVIFDVVGSPGVDRDSKIVITAQDQEQLIAIWMKQWRRPPTAQEFQGLLEAHIREQVLYREAMAMGLDEDDTIIRRRLAQKMEFLAQDIGDAVEPTEEELAAFLQQNRERFVFPARYTFSHVYVSTDRRGDAAAGYAAEILEQLRSGADPEDLGDRFMLQRHFTRRTRSDVAQQFGMGFADRLVELEHGVWVGPVQSGYGLHLVRIEGWVEQRDPVLDEVRQKVKDELQSQRRKQADREMYQRFREDYEIVVEPLTTDDAA
jgi:parvulin-like peptidyl-prolyl isomerase